MARTKTNVAQQATKDEAGSKNSQTTETVTEQKETKKEKVVLVDEIQHSENPSLVDKLMRLYPQYKKIWVTPNGFVHPEGVPEYLTKGATLYENKYYK
jgi:thymidine kinase